MTPAGDYVIRIALEHGLLRREQLESARARVAAQRAPAAAPPGIVPLLVADGTLDARALARAVAGELGMPFVELGDRPIAREALAALPRSFVTQHLVCPVGLADGTLQVALADPLDLDLLDNLERVAGRPVRAGVATEQDLRQAIRRHYGEGGGAIEDLLGGLALTAAVPPDGGGEPAPEAVKVETSDAPIIKLVHSIIRDAAIRRASDIHFEPLERRFRVRYRIDGVLVEVDSPAKRLQPALISRLKIMANISIAEKRLPQDGRIQVSLAGQPLDLRVSSLPTVHGESIVLRLLDQQGLNLGLPELGFSGEDEEQFKRLISAPDGILLVTGPTGSGKTTTLYSCLHHLNQPDRKIITVEDPVEYQLNGINQVPVRAEIGMTFASALRALLRQAPNIIMVGEIRDRETTEIALNASLTGHLVFSTLHTSDAPGAVSRLIDLGAKPFLLAAALRATMAQRLVRRICPACKRPYAPSVRELHALGLSRAQLAGAAFAHGAGCAECHGSGYRGRMGIFEIFFISDEIRGMIHDQASPARLRDRARRDGMRTMRDDGIRKVLAGHTTIEEVASVTFGAID